MNKYLRKIARHNMVKAGITQINKPQWNANGTCIGSKFSRNWRDFI